MHKIVPTDAKLIPDIATRAFKGVIFDIYQWHQQQFDDSQAVFEMFKRPDTVEVLAIKDGKLLFQREEQPHVGERYGLPGGRVDPADTSWLAAAKRECLEETGCRFKHWRLINVVQPLHKGEWFIAFYVAWELMEEVAMQHDPGERIVQELLTLEAAKAKLSQPPTRNIEHELYELLKPLHTVEGLLEMPEFQGQAVDR